MNLNIRISFSFRVNECNYSKHQELMAGIVVYIIGKISGDLFFSYSDCSAYLERRSGVIAVAPKTFEYFPELESMLNYPYIIKALEIKELSDDDINYVL